MMGFLIVKFSIVGMIVWYIVNLINNLIKNNLINHAFFFIY